MFLRKQLGAELKDTRPIVGTQRLRCYELPPLKDCRRLFSESAGAAGRLGVGRDGRARSGSRATIGTTMRLRNPCRRRPRSVRANPNRGIIPDDVPRSLNATGGGQPQPICEDRVGLQETLIFIVSVQPVQSVQSIFKVSGKNEAVFADALPWVPRALKKHMLISRCQVLAKRLGRLVSLDRPSVYNGLSRPTPLSRPTSRRTDCPVASSIDNVTLCAGRS